MRSQGPHIAREADVAPQRLSHQVWALVLCVLVLTIAFATYTGRGPESQVRADEGASPDTRTEVTPDPLALNRLLLEKWRKDDPNHYLLLKERLAAFWKLPPQRQQKLRQLDRDWNALDAQKRKRLEEVLRRYLAWRERLQEKDRDYLDSAADWQQRLARVKEIRARQWFENLPAAMRAHLEKLPPKARERRLEVIRRAESKQRQLWQRMRGRLRPVSLLHLPVEMQLFVAEKLYPRLTPEEKKRLNRVGSSGPALARLLVELNERHPYPPPIQNRKVLHPEDLPPEVQRHLREQLSKPGPGNKLLKARGSWPDFALLVAQELKQANKPVPPLGASRLQEFPQGAQQFVNKKLLPVLTPPEEEELRTAQGKWPDYSLLVFRLARDHKMGIPELSLPDAETLTRALPKGKLKKGGK